MNNIYLIGMPGSGKSTIGKILSKKLNLKHIDADLYLEQKFGEEIPHIFETKGEQAFRQMETQVIRELSDMDSIIVSTGGGAVTRQENKIPMKKSGIVVFIDSLPETILDNSSLDGRPLLKDKNKVFDLYSTRISMYRDFADITADNNGLIDNTVSSILNQLKRKE